MITVEPVLEVLLPEGFTLWPVAPHEPFGLLPLHGALDSAHLGAAVAAVAHYNAVAAAVGPVPADPPGAFLHGLLTCEVPQSPGGLRVVDTVTGVTLLPGCCCGLEEWAQWWEVVDEDGAGHGGRWDFGHDPSPAAERVGGTVRLSVDTGSGDGPGIDVPVAGLRRLLSGAERDLAGFLESAAPWAARWAPAHAGAVLDALARAVGMPGTAGPRRG